MKTLIFILIINIFIFGCAPREDETFTPVRYTMDKTGNTGGFSPTLAREIEVMGQKYVIIQGGNGIAICPSKNK
jgi:hypothetical protein